MGKRTGFGLLAFLLLTASSPALAHTEDWSWEALKKHPVPEWFKDAKFGIYAHWGVYTVPEYGNDWYPRNMYLEGDVQDFHIKKFGPLATFGYKEFIPLFRARKFDPAAWAELYVRAGAKFAGPVAEHHDGFSMWASQVNRWNSAQMGPMRDVTGELTAALRARGLKIVASLHHAYNFQGFFPRVEGTDTADPQYADLYGQFQDKQEAHERWLNKAKELIKAYQPDQLWFDFGLKDIPDEYKRRMASFYYSHEQQWNKEVIIARKGDHLPEGVGVLDIERGKMRELSPTTWQTDDSISARSWSYVGQEFKSARELIHELIDIVSKNGIFLLNVCPREDGTFTKDQEDRLYAIGGWLQVNGEAIYGTRPWALHGDGPNLNDRGRGFAGNQIGFSAEDIRYTSKDGSLYAIVLGWPSGELVLPSVFVKGVPDGASLSLLGYDGEVPYRVNENGRLAIQIPEIPDKKRPAAHACAFRIAGFNLEPREAVVVNLRPEIATLEGSRLMVEERIAGRKCIGHWDDPEERVHWLVYIRKAGTYSVSGKFSAATGMSQIVLSVAGKAPVAAVRRTSDWDEIVEVRFGEVYFGQPGIYPLVLSAAFPANWRPLNVWGITLNLEHTLR